MRVYIKVTDSLRRELASRFEVSKPTVWSALNYLTKSDLAEAIRQYALAHGGAIEEQNFVPNCRTEYTEDEIIQTFAGGVQVRMDRHKGDVSLMQGGKNLESYGAISLQAWGNLLYHAQKLSEESIAKATKK